MITKKKKKKKDCRADLREKQFLDNQRGAILRGGIDCSGRERWEWDRRRAKSEQTSLESGFAIHSGRARVSTWGDMESKMTGKYVHALKNRKASPSISLEKQLFQPLLWRPINKSMLLLRLQNNFYTHFASYIFFGAILWRLIGRLLLFLCAKALNNPASLQHC